jgi:hypothetical protein
MHSNAKYCTAPTKALTHVITLLRNQGGSVSPVADYRLDNWSLIPSSSKGFFFWHLHPDQLWKPLNLLSNKYWGSFPRVKVRPGHDADYSPPSNAEVKKEWSFSSSTCAPGNVLMNE